MGRGIKLPERCHIETSMLDGRRLASTAQDLSALAEGLDKTTKRLTAPIKMSVRANTTANPPK